MLIVIICACIVGGMWWRTENRIKRLQKEMKSTENLIRKDLADNLVEQWKSEAEIERKITLLAKDMIEMQTTVSNLEYKSKSKKHANTKVNRTK